MNNAEVIMPARGFKPYKHTLLVTRAMYDEIKPYLMKYEIGKDYTHGLCSDCTTVAIQTNRIDIALEVSGLTEVF